MVNKLKQKQKITIITVLYVVLRFLNSGYDIVGWNFHFHRIRVPCQGEYHVKLIVGENGRKKIHPNAVKICLCDFLMVTEKTVIRRPQWWSTGCWVRILTN